MKVSVNCIATSAELNTSLTLVDSYEHAYLSFLNKCALVQKLVFAIMVLGVTSRIKFIIQCLTLALFGLTYCS
jgi:hypothetical protein